MSISAKWHLRWLGSTRHELQREGVEREVGGEREVRGREVRRTNKKRGVLWD